ETSEFRSYSMDFLRAVLFDSFSLVGEVHRPVNRIDLVFDIIMSEGGNTRSQYRLQTELSKVLLERFQSREVLVSSGPDLVQHFKIFHRTLTAHPGCTATSKATTLLALNMHANMAHFICKLVDRLWDVSSLLKPLPNIRSKN
ncbi:hypothetical protein Ciccas_005790, partial [Cichlidogyrus casuarinus]